MGGGGRVRAEAWWASRGGSSDERNAREGGRGGRGVRREGGREKAEASCIAALSTRGSKLRGLGLKSKS